ncbi:MAG: gamma carbonic anhydrase family protein [Candidatus Altiarchaeales archaeon]|nr:gamma carbonic anhydrase family protein [Candidatus Altiarchaeales archaeon]MBD3415821.1 gamma carbonic anhydrase family protein [Candidatus Altiarchaeales archaeon]
MIDETVFIAEGARVIGKVALDAHSSVWYNAVLRGDRNRIIVGKCTNIQDCCVIHSPEHFPVRIGDYVTIGHGAKVHGAEIGDNTLIGMGTILMNGCKIGANSVVMAASVVTENTIIPAGSLAVGNPAVVKRQLGAEEIESIKQNALDYKALAANSR